MNALELVRITPERLSGERRYTPPSWLRHLLPWKLLNWINDHSDVCWAGVVMWKLGYGWSWWPRRSCFEGGDYCGKFDGRPQPEIPEAVLIRFKE